MPGSGFQFSAAGADKGEVKQNVPASGTVLPPTSVEAPQRKVEGVAIKDDKDWEFVRDLLNSLQNEGE